MFPLLAVDPATRLWESLLSAWRDFLTQLPWLVAGLIVLGLTWGAAVVISRFVERVLRTSRLRPSFQVLCHQLTNLSVWIVGITISAMIIFPGLTPTRALAVLGLGSMAVGLAFKDIFENFFAGVLILWRFPFDPGDYIACEDVTGKVEKITIRMTLVRRVDGRLITIPNAFLFKRPVDVLTSWPVRRITIIVGIAYGEDVDEAREVMREAVGRCESVNKEKPIEIFAQEFASSSINFEVTWWTGSTPLEERRSRDEVVAAIKRGLDTAGIEIPFPYRTLTFKEPIKVDDAN